MADIQDNLNSNVSFRVHKEDLSDAVAWVARMLPTKNTQPILRAVLITASDEGLEFAGFDYEVSSRVRIAAEVDTPGRVAVAGKLLSDIVANMPNQPVEVSTSDTKLLLDGGSAHFELPLMPVSYTHLTLPTIHVECRSRWSPYH